MPGNDKQKQMWIILKARDLTNKAFKSMKKTGGESIKALKNGFAKLKIAVLGFATAIIAVAIVAVKKLTKATVELMKGAIDVTGQFEVLRIQMGVLLGSVEKGEQAFAQLWDIAKKLPFTIDEIARTAKTLKAWSVSGENMETAIISIADAAALAGVKMDQMATIIGRAWQQGILLTRGPGSIIKGMIKTKFGIDSTKLSLIEFRKVLARILTDPNAGIAGMAQKLATTFVGIKSMIKDAITNIKVEIGKSGLFDEVKGLAQDVLDFLRMDKIILKLKELGKIGKRIVNDLRTKLFGMLESGRIEEVLDDWIDNFSKLGDIASGVIANLPAIIQMFMKFATSFIKFMNLMFKSVNKLIVKLNILTGDTSAFTLASLRGAQRMEFWSESVNNTGDAIDRLNSLQKKSGKEFKDSGLAGLKARKSFEVFKRAIQDSGISLKLFQEEFDAVKKRFDLVGREGTGEQGRKIQFEVATEDAVSLLKEIVREINTEAKAQNDANRALNKQKKLLEEGLDLGIKDKDINQLINDILKDRDAIINKNAKGIDKLTTSLEDAYNIGIDGLKNTTEQWNIFINNMEANNKAFGDIMASSAKASASAFEDLFFDVMTNNFNDLRDYIIDFATDVTRILSQMLAKKASMAIIESFAGGASPLPTPIGTSGASGGTAGSISAGIPGGAVPQAVRFPEGGRAPFQFGGIVQGNAGIDNIPVMASSGEMILNQGQQAGLFKMINNGGVGQGGGGGSAPVIININAMDSQDVFRALTKNPRVLGAVQSKGQMLNRRGFKS